jgi:hypothetical protein
LRAKFEEETVAALGADYAAGTWGGFDKLGVTAGLAQGIGADQAGDSGTDNEDWNVSSHGMLQHPIILNGSFRL